jgi:type IV pilus assembly protein PilA
MVRSRNGFTLVELLVVVVILGILAAIAVPKLSGSQDKAKLAAMKSDVRNAETAEESYFSDNGRYGSLGQLQAAGFTLSPQVTMRVTATRRGYTLRATNRSIRSAINGCSVQVGGGVAMTNDGVISCP